MNAQQVHGKEREKFHAGVRGAEMVADGMVVGLGTGSTAAYATRRIGERQASGELKVEGAVCTSRATLQLAGDLGIPVLEPAAGVVPDLYIDGADEVDPQGNMIKGGGGALLWEKLVATSARRRIIVVDQAKRVQALGRAFPLPVEIIRFAAEQTFERLRSRVPKLAWRCANGGLLVTDEGHYIADLDLRSYQGTGDVLEWVAQLPAMEPGVVETGLFRGLCDVLIAGDQDGATVHELSPAR